ncbi:MAG: peptide deformylase [Candidatus Dormibacteraeota bacterium]|uniref:Peptide deformylase n=1 Tax=Candidatus Amunia macphersoniae TaxID=3127014 RepID=A0A934KF30_9BACT|nr:peptide deformylase [Candidatus Dormibacteraeota bacterium]
MAVLPIVLTTDKDPVLTTRATRVPRVDDTVRKLMDDMVETMIEAHGAGLAAPQVGVSQRVIVLRVDNQVYQLANPETVRCEGEQTGFEGCLSVPGLIGEVTRCERVVARGLNRHGKEIRVKGDGLLARAIQHEIDHLDGILFTTKVIEGTLRPWELAHEQEAEAVEGELVG